MSKDATTDRLDTLLSQIMLRSECRLLRRLDYVPSLKSDKKRESNTVLRLDAILDYAAKADPELKQSQRQLFVLAEEMSDLSQLYVDPTQRKKAGLSSIQVLLAIAKVTNKLWERYGNMLLKFNTSAPQLNMESETKEKFPGRLRHLGHYVPTVSRLLDFASSFSVFRSIQIRTTHIKPYNFSTMVIQDKPDSQQRFLGPESQILRRTDEWRRKLTHAVTKGQKQVRKYITQPHLQRSIRVHAEIQILCYYEQHPHIKFPPRVLKSSKHACFLCDLFIKTHGKFHIPKTHGKLYELWMLPNICELDLDDETRENFIQVMHRFNEAIEKAINPPALRASQSLPEPDESCILSLVNYPHAASNTTMHPLPESGSLARSNSPLHTQTVDTSTSPQPATSPMQSGEPKEGLEVLPPILESSVLQLNLPEHADKSVQVATPISPPPILFLRQGKSSTYVFDKTNTIVRFHTPKIHVELSHEEAEQLVNADSSPKDDKSFVAITVEVSWLGREESSQFSKPEDNAINLNSRWTEITATNGILFTDEGLLMRKGTEMVKIRALHVDSQRYGRKDSLHG